MSGRVLAAPDLHSEPVTSEERKPGGVQSVERAITILEFLARNGWSGVTDVGAALGVHKSTAFRLMSTLEQRGLVEQHTDSGKYRLGVGIAHLARAVTVNPDITQNARAGCEWLARHTDETVTLTVLGEADCVTIDQIVSSSSVASQSWLGRHTPLHATSPGKVFLAHLDKERLTRLTRGPLHRFTDRTLVGRDELYAELARVREDGVATAVDEFEDGLTSAAAPVRASDGSVVAAICASGPSYRLDAEQLRRLASLVRDAADLASTRLGFRVSGPG